jgi:hypothetical protein
MNVFKNRRYNIVLELMCMALIFITIISIAFVYRASHPPAVQEQVQIVESEIPEELIFSLANLESCVGSSMDQRMDLHKISEALQDGTVTSKSLGKTGQHWLAQLRYRVDVREAVEALRDLNELREKALVGAISRYELPRIEKLRKVVEAQIDSKYADDEDLVCTHAGLNALVERIIKN